MAAHMRTIPQEMFDIISFRKGQEVTPECDSIGCTIGICTVLDSKPLPMKSYGAIDFHTWSIGFTGIDDDERDWCFAPDWIDADNTPLGAALRIEWLLDHGLPEDMDSQINGKAPLCYTPKK